MLIHFPKLAFWRKKLTASYDDNFSLIHTLSYVFWSCEIPTPSFPQFSPIFQKLFKFWEKQLVTLLFHRYVILLIKLCLISQWFQIKVSKITYTKGWWTQFQNILARFVKSTDLSRLKNFLIYLDGQLICLWNVNLSLIIKAVFGCVYRTTKTIACFKINKRWDGSGNIPCTWHITISMKNDVLRNRLNPTSRILMETIQTSILAALLCSLFSLHVVAAYNICAP